MPRNVNVRLSNSQITGLNVSVPQRSIDITVTWIDNNNVTQTDTRTALFPNILSNAALPAGWLKDHLEDLLYQAVREIVGIDT